MKPFTSGKTLQANGETFTFDSARDAIDALRWLRDQGAVEAVFPCGWLVDVGCEDGSWIIPCGSVAVGTDRGWHGFCGHAHVTAEVRFAEGWDYVEAEEAQAIRSGHYLPSFVPVDMEGRAI